MHILPRRGAAADCTFAGAMRSILTSKNNGRPGEDPGGRFQRSSTSARTRYARGPLVREKELFRQGQPVLIGNLGGDVIQSHSAILGQSTDC